jgi:hypothetical protein
MIPGDGPEHRRAENERELLDVIGPEIERRAMRRQFRNFIVFVAILLGLMACAYGVWNYLGSPTFPFLLFGYGPNNQ